MTEFAYQLCTQARPFLFVALFLYLPMKWGVSFDLAGQPPTADEIRAERNKQIALLAKPTFLVLLTAPFRILTIAWFSLWLLIDKCPIALVALLVVSLVPLYL